MSNNKNANENPIANNAPFTSDRQPSPEAKKKGWERRRQGQEIMNKLMEYMSMTQSQFEDLFRDIKENPDKHTVQDILLYKYATKAFNGEKFMLDWFDRNISKAPIQVETPEDGGITINVKTSKE